MNKGTNGITKDGFISNYSIMAIILLATLVGIAIYSLMQKSNSNTAAIIEI